MPRSSRSSPCAFRGDAERVVEGLVEHGYLGRGGLPESGGGRAPCRRHRAEDAGADRRLRRRDGSGGRMTAIGAPIRRQGPPGGGTILDRSVARTASVEPACPGRPGGADPARACPDPASRDAGGGGGGPGSPLHAPRADELRPRLGDVPVGLLHDEVQPEGRRDGRRPAGLPAPPPAPAGHDDARERWSSYGGSSGPSARSPVWLGPRCSRRRGRAGR